MARCQNCKSVTMIQLRSRLTFAILFFFIFWPFYYSRINASFVIKKKKKKKKKSVSINKNMTVPV